MPMRSIRTQMLGLVVATVVPFTVLIGAGLWQQWRGDQAAAINRALDEARLLAAQIDDHIGNLDNLLTGMSRAVSWDPADTEANDALFRKVKSELPTFIANILLFTPDGINIGTSSDYGRIFAGDRDYFQGVLAGQPRAISAPLRSRAGGDWVVTVAHPVHDDTGHLRAVLTIGTLLERFQDTFNTPRLPRGSIVRVVDRNGTVVTRSEDALSWIGRDLSAVPSVVRHLQAKEASEVVRWADDVERITGSATTNLAPWLVSVGLPTDIAFATVLRRLGVGALFVLVTLLIASATAWILSGRIVRPLRQLGRDAARLASGKLNHRSTVGTSDEVGTLANAFNRMAEHLEQRQVEAIRTADDLRQAKQTLTAVIDASPVAIICSDPERRIFLWNRSAEQIFDYTAEEAIGQFAHLVPPRREDESRRLFDRVMAGEILRNVRLKRRRKDGATVDVRAAFAPMYNPDGTVHGVVRAYEDITDYVRAEEQLERIAHFDQLTGLPNRLTLRKELGRLLAGEGNGPTAIALFDLDGFKDVNDTLGHSSGDQLLIDVGQRLSNALSGRGQVCRLGGDEFVAIIPGCGDPLVIGEMIDSMLRRLGEPYRINDQILHIAGSAGVAIAPTDGANVDELIANADLALYQAKSDGGHACRFFVPVLRAQAQTRRGLGLELRRAHEQNEFELYFQPQIRLVDNTVVGAEALIRWQHPKRGILAPGIFIDTLAASSIAPDVSRWIIRTACNTVAKWRAAGLPLGRIGVNLFPSQLSDEASLRDIDDALTASGLPSHVLELEITENVALNTGNAAALQKLHDRGVQLAFDDFGTGYASLSYLTRFPLTRIKIDRGFIGKITDDAGDAAIVRSLIVMAHNLGLGVIAEGVETKEQAAFLLEQKCEEVQGYLYAKPLSASDFEAYLRTQRLPDEEAVTAKQVGRHNRFHRSGKIAPSRRRVPSV
jgi:diguanylate cyclase (GGDEF)-like protein/PAS domain S-box-containing protein